jgi:hypothetical protein
VTSVQQRTGCGGTPADVGTAATPEGASVSSDRSAKTEALHLTMTEITVLIKTPANVVGLETASEGKSPESGRFPGIVASR